MDTRFWGPDGWRLLHSIAAAYPSKPTPLQQETYRIFFTCLQYILPCIYCRRSYTEYIHQIPMTPYLKNRRSLSKWLWKIHNLVNDKLRRQGLVHEDDPSFEEIYAQYLTHVKEINASDCTPMPGWNFLYCVLFNYPKQSSEMELDRRVHYVVFLYYLPKVLPFPPAKKVMTQYLREYPVQQSLSGQVELTKWGHGLEYRISKQIECTCINYRKRCAMIEQYRAGCGGKKDKKPTCRLGNSPKPANI